MAGILLVRVETAFHIHWCAMVKVIVKMEVMNFCVGTYAVNYITASHNVANHNANVHQFTINVRIPGNALREQMCAMANVTVKIIVMN